MGNLRDERRDFWTIQQGNDVLIGKPHRYNCVFQICPSDEYMELLSRGESYAERISHSHHITTLQDATTEMTRQQDTVHGSLTPVSTTVSAHIFAKPTQNYPQQQQHPFGDSLLSFQKIASMLSPPTTIPNHLPQQDHQQMVTIVTPQTPPSTLSLSSAATMMGESMHPSTTKPISATAIHINLSQPHSTVESLPPYQGHQQQQQQQQHQHPTQHDDDASRLGPSFPDPHDLRQTKNCNNNGHAFPVATSLVHLVTDREDATTKKARPKKKDAESSPPIKNHTTTRHDSMTNLPTTFTSCLSSTKDYYYREYNDDKYKAQMAQKWGWSKQWHDHKELIFRDVIMWFYSLRFELFAVTSDGHLSPHPQQLLFSMTPTLVSRISQVFVRGGKDDDSEEVYDHVLEFMFRMGFAANSFLHNSRRCFVMRISHYDQCLHQTIPFRIVARPIKYDHAVKSTATGVGDPIGVTPISRKKKSGCMSRGTKRSRCIHATDDGDDATIHDSGVVVRKKARRPDQSLNHDKQDDVPMIIVEEEEQQNNDPRIHQLDSTPNHTQTATTPFPTVTTMMMMGATLTPPSHPVHTHGDNHHTMTSHKDLSMRDMECTENISSYQSPFKRHHHQHTGPTSQHEPLSQQTTAYHALLPTVLDPNAIMTALQEIKTKIEQMEQHQQHLFLLLRQQQGGEDEEQPVHAMLQASSNESALCVFSDLH